MTEPYSNAQTTANQPDWLYRPSLTNSGPLGGLPPAQMEMSIGSASLLSRADKETLEAIRHIVREEIDRSLHRTSFVLTTLQHIKEALQTQEDLHHDLWGTPTAQLLAWVEEAMEELA